MATPTMDGLVKKSNQAYLTLSGEAWVHALATSPQKANATLMTQQRSCRISRVVQNLATCIQAQRNLTQTRNCMKASMNYLRMQTCLRTVFKMFLMPCKHSRKFLEKIPTLAWTTVCDTRSTISRHHLIRVLD